MVTTMVLVVILVMARGAGRTQRKPPSNFFSYRPLPPRHSLTNRETLPCVSSSLPSLQPPLSFSAVVNVTSPTFAGRLLASPHRRPSFPRSDSEYPLTPVSSSIKGGGGGEPYRASPFSPNAATKGLKTCEIVGVTVGGSPY